MRMISKSIKWKKQSEFKGMLANQDKIAGARWCNSFKLGVRYNIYQLTCYNLFKLNKLIIQIYQKFCVELARKLHIYIIYLTLIQLLYLQNSCLDFYFICLNNDKDLFLNKYCAQAWCLIAVS